MLLRNDRALLALDILLDIGFHAGRGAEVTGAADIAERLGAQRRGIEPILQALGRAGLLESLRGPRGGYRLARPPRAISLLAAVDAVLEGDAPPEAANRLSEAATRPLWRSFEAELRERLAMQTLADLLRRAAAAGLRRPVTEPLDFVI